MCVVKSACIHPGRLYTVGEEYGPFYLCGQESHKGTSQLRMDGGWQSVSSPSEAFAKYSDSGRAGTPDDSHKPPSESRIPLPPFTQEAVKANC